MWLCCYLWCISSERLCPRLPRVLVEQISSCRGAADQTPDLLKAELAVPVRVEFLVHHLLQILLLLRQSGVALKDRTGLVERVQELVQLTRVQRRVAVLVEGRKDSPVEAVRCE